MRVELLFVAAVLGLAASPIGAARGAVLTETASVANYAAAAGPRLVQLPDFDPSLGNLTSVGLSIAGELTPLVTGKGASTPTVTFNPGYNAALDRSRAVFSNRLAPMTVPVSNAPTFAFAATPALAVADFFPLDPAGFGRGRNVIVDFAASAGISPLSAFDVLADQTGFNGTIGLDYRYDAVQFDPLASNVVEPASIAVIGFGLALLPAARRRSARRSGPRAAAP